MKIALYNLEPNIVNSAMMQVSYYHNQKGDQVYFYSPLFHSTYDKIYAFSIFDFTPKDYVTKDMIVGGTGFDPKINLPPEMEESLYNALPTFNPQRLQSKPYKKVRPKSETFRNYGKHIRVPTESKDGSRCPISVLPFSRVENGVHPTQKPLELFEWLIKTYTNEGDLVLDPFLGSGTTALACLRLQRNFIAFELEEKYFKIANERIKPFNLEQKRLEEFLEDE